MSYVQDDFEDEAIAIVSEITGLPAVFSHQNAPRPNTNYITLQIITDVSKEHPDYRETDSENIEVVQWQELTLQCKSVGPDSMKVMSNLKRKIRQVQYEDRFELVFAGMQYVTTLNSVPVLRENGWEDQAVFDIVFNTVTKDIEDVGYIDSVEIEGTLNNRTVNFEA